MPTAYPTEFKVKTIRRYEKGESIKALSQELHISQSRHQGLGHLYESVRGGGLRPASGSVGFRAAQHRNAAVLLAE